MKFLNRNILICCHDAGSANLIYFWKKKFNKNNFYFYNKGPAKNIFGEKNIKLNKINKFSIDLIITGTSQFSKLENEIRLIAKKNKIYSITFLDHYVNYKKRFYLDGKLKLPDEIWSFDIYSFRLARQLFNNVIVKKKINYFIYYLKKKLKLKLNFRIIICIYRTFFLKKGDEFIYLNRFLNFRNKKDINIGLNYIH